MKQVILQNANQSFTIDDEDYDNVVKHSWFLNSRAITTNIKDKTITIGQFLLNCLPLEADHKDRNIFNNQKINLRKATKSQNAVNKIYPIGKSGYRGITFLKGKYKAQISVGGRNIHIGTYTDPKEAAKAYNELAIYHYGEFAVLNDL